MKKRLDVLVFERGLAASRERAQRLIIANEVLVDDQPCSKPGTSFPDCVALRLRNPDFPYVSRGALKLLRALDHFAVDVAGKAGLDVGSSTGGFTEVLLERGAVSVLALDAGTNQLDWKLRNDPRVRSMEKTNARHLEFKDLGQTFDVITVDVSFISLAKILPALTQFMHPSTDLLTLVKPQFEVGPAEVGKGGIVRSEASRQGALERVRSSGEAIDLIFVGHTLSPITGTDGNVEFLAHWRRKAVPDS